MKKDLVLILFTILFSLSAFSETTQQRHCRNYFGNVRFWDSALNYKEDVLRTRGGRLFLAPPAEPVPHRAWGLVVQEQLPEYTPGPISSIYYFFNYVLPHKIVDLTTQPPLTSIKKIGPWRFAPFQFLERNFLDKPTEAVSQNILYTRKRLSLLAKLPLFILLSFKSYEMYDQFAWRQFDNKIEESILLAAEKSPDLFESLALNDYRYEAYKTDLYLSTGKLNMTTVQDIAAHNRIIYEYYKLRDNIRAPLSLEDEIQAFGNNPLFSGITSLFELSPTSYSYLKFKNTTYPYFSDAQKSKAFKERHLLMYQYQALDLVVFNSSAIKVYKENQKKDEFMDSLLGDPVIQSLIHYHDLGIFSVTKAKYLAQKYLHTLSFVRTLDALEIEYYLMPNEESPLSEATIQAAAHEEIQSHLLK